MKESWIYLWETKTLFIARMLCWTSQDTAVTKMVIIQLTSGSSYKCTCFTMACAHSWISEWIFVKGSCMHICNTTIVIALRVSWRAMESRPKLGHKTSSRVLKFLMEVSQVSHTIYTLILTENQHVQRHCLERSNWKLYYSWVKMMCVLLQSGGIIPLTRLIQWIHNVNLHQLHYMIQSLPGHLMVSMCQQLSLLHLRWPQLWLVQRSRQSHYSNPQGSLYVQRLA